MFHQRYGKDIKQISSEAPTITIILLQIVLQTVGNEEYFFSNIYFLQSAVRGQWSAVSDDDGRLFEAG